MQNNILKKLLITKDNKSFFLSVNRNLVTQLADTYGLKKMKNTPGFKRNYE